MEQELEKVAREELNETPQRKEKDLQSLKEWLSMQPHLNPRLDDKFLLSFLRNTKYRLEAAKEKVDAYYTFRVNNPDFYKNRYPLKPHEMKLMKSGAYLPLPTVNPLDYGQVSISALGLLNELECSVADYFKMVTIINDRDLIYNENTTIIGQHSIIDFKNTTIITATQCTALAKKLVNGLENIYPVRIMGFHLINLNQAPPIFEMVIKIGKGFFKTKLVERIYIHDTLESLYKVIPKSILPTEYGGEAGSMETIMQKSWFDRGLNEEKWFNDDEQYKSDESKRIGGSKANELFGTEGSFRQMDID